jgi:hypothetical protein
MQIGDRVRVKISVIVYHHPEHRNQPFDIQGSEGDIVAFVKELNGKEVSANYPVLVQFEKKFRTHLSEVELELV